MSTGSKSPSSSPTPQIIPVGPKYTRDGRDGFPAESVFEAIIDEYVNGLNARKREKALMTQAMYDNILRILLDPDNTSFSTAQFRFWSKKMFRLVTTRHAHVITHENRPVAVREQIYDVLVQCHGQCSHGGRDKTSGQVRRYYSWIPKELIARFVKICPLCQNRRSTQTRTGEFTYGPSSPSYGSLLGTPTRQAFYPTSNYSPSQHHLPAVIGYAPPPINEYNQLLNEAANAIPRDLSLNLAFLPPHLQMPPSGEYQQFQFPPMPIASGSGMAHIDPCMSSNHPVTPPRDGMPLNQQFPTPHFPASIVMTPRTMELVGSWGGSFGAPNLLPSLNETPFDYSVRPNLAHRGSIDSSAITDLDYESDRPHTAQSSQLNSPSAPSPRGIQINSSVGQQAVKTLTAPQQSEYEVNIEDLNMDNLPSLESSSLTDLAGMALLHNVIDVTPVVVSSQSAQLATAHQQSRQSSSDIPMKSTRPSMVSADVEEVQERQRTTTITGQKLKPPPLVLDCNNLNVNLLEPSSFLSANLHNTHISGAHSAPAHVTQFLHPTMPLLSPGLTTPGSEASSSSQPMLHSQSSYADQLHAQQTMAAPPSVHVSAPASAPLYPGYASMANTFYNNGQVPSDSSFFVPPLSMMHAIQGSPFFQMPLTTQQQQQASRDLSESIQQLLDNISPNPGAQPEVVRPTRASSLSPPRRSSR